MHLNMFLLLLFFSESRNIAYRFIIPEIISLLFCKYVACNGYGFIKNELVSDWDPVLLRYSHCNDDADDVDENILYGDYG